MLKSRYIEDIFVEFVDLCDHRKITLAGQDWSAVQSFSHIILGKSQLTKNQANFIVKILQKYKIFAKSAGLDYTEDLVDPQWKNSFRILDLSKRIFLEEDEEGVLWIVMKFPYALKEVLEKEISPVVKEYNQSVWDSENKVRKIKFYNFNAVEVFEFAQRHNFEIDDSFMIALAEVEEIWENSEKISPSCSTLFDDVVLHNANEDTVSFFENNRSGKVGRDLLLAKSMGYFLSKKPENLVEKIAASTHTHFHLKTLEDFFTVYKSVGGTVAVVTNKENGTENWVKEFCEISKKFEVPADEIRVCYRLDKNEDKGFNQWVKDSGYGGKVEGAKILIFQNKPAKWLFSDNTNVKIILTNSLYPIPSNVTQTWMDGHSCVCFVGNIKAAGHKDRKIVEL